MADHPVMRLTQEAYDALKTELSANPDLWLNPQANFENILVDKGIPDYAEPTSVVSVGSISLQSDLKEPSNRRHRSDRQALGFYQSLQGMTPEIATDPNIWAWITHFRLHAYALARWPYQSGRDKVAHFESHWFCTNARDAVWRHNTASRTWWVGHISEIAASESGGIFSALDAVQHFAYHPRHYHNMLSSNITKSPLVLAEVTRALLNEAQGISGEGSDQIWKRLNLSAGVALLDAMPRDALRALIVTAVDEIMSIPRYVTDRTKIRTEPVKVLSLGAGVQSTCLALMADRGEFGLEKPDFAIFADTGWEPKAVYEHLDWLEKELSYDVYRVNNGNLKANLLAGGELPNGSKHIGIPAFVANPDGGKGILRRQCTTHYKMTPIHRKIREYLEVPDGKPVPKDKRIEMWLGISLDESVRQKPSQESWITKRYPLIENSLSRADLYDWFRRKYPGIDLPKSACIGCPYHDDSMWKDLRDKNPQEFLDAVEVDMALRDNPQIASLINGKAFLHRSRKPLIQVDFSDVQGYEERMNEECEGLCGI